MAGSWSLLSSALASPPLLHTKQPSPPSLHSNSKWRVLSFLHDKHSPPVLSAKASQSSQLQKLASLLQYGVILTSVEAPSALALTGENEDFDLVTTVISWGIVAVLYLFVAPPLIMNWMRQRWFKRRFLEMYLQFLCTFLFFPGLMLWAPFLNFRKFPRDPTMKYPWSTPKEDTPLYKTR